MAQRLFDRQTFQYELVTDSQKCHKEAGLDEPKIWINTIPVFTAALVFLLSASRGMSAESSSSL